MKTLDYYMSLQYAVLVNPLSDGYILTLPELDGLALRVKDCSYHDGLELLREKQREYFIDCIAQKKYIPIPKEAVSLDIDTV